MPKMVERWKFAHGQWWRRFTKSGRRNLRAARSLRYDPAYREVIEHLAARAKPYTLSMDYRITKEPVTDKEEGE